MNLPTYIRLHTAFYNGPGSRVQVVNALLLDQELSQIRNMELLPSVTITYVKTWVHPPAGWTSPKTPQRSGMSKRLAPCSPSKKPVSAVVQLMSEHCGYA